MANYFHALDSMKLAQEIQKDITQLNVLYKSIFLERKASMDLALKEARYAILPELEGLDNLQIVGLMTMAPFEASPGRVASHICSNSPTSKELQKKQMKNMPFTELSMGMSRDYDVAVLTVRLCTNWDLVFQIGRIMSFKNGI